jgi:hypothetical protein
VQKEVQHVARKTTKGTGLLGVEIDLALLDQFKDFARSRHETQREVVELALRRHMANPPTLEPPPLPPLVPPSPEPAPKKGGKKK